MPVALWFVMHQMCTSLESLQQSLSVVQRQMSEGADDPLSLDVDNLREQIASHDTLLRYLAAHESDIKIAAQTELGERTRNSAGNLLSCLLQLVVQSPDVICV